MINFYKEWKEDKNSTSKRNAKGGHFECPICLRKVNGLKAHMNDSHGDGTYKKFLEAEEKIRENKRKELLKEMGLGDVLL